VAPITMVQVLIGKYFAYILFLGIITVVLTALLVFGLGVPFLGSLGAFAAFALLYLVACIGVGFLVSAISRTENQAIQISMLILLLSIFFSGFILPLEYFRPETAIITNILPISHANVGFRSLMLLGHLVSPFNVYALGIIALVSFVLVLVVWGRQFRRLA
jgi:ABC-2 type transport system permease protein